MKNKSGELTTKHLVGLIILIVSFAIILFFIFRLNLGENTDSEVCHNSVLMKGGPDAIGELTSLKCKTQVICITAKGGDCGVPKPTVKKAQTKPEVYKILADELAECWWMFGEGEINYVGKDWTSGNLYCSNCDQIIFDASVKERIFNGGDLSKEELFQFLADETIPGGEIKYLNYLYGETANLEGIKQDIKKNPKTSFGSLNLDEQYFLTTGIVSDYGKLRWVLGAGAVVGIVGGLVLAPFTAGFSLSATGAIVAGLAAGATVSTVTAIFLPGGSGNDYLRPAIVSPDEYTALQCEDVITLS